MPAPGYQRELSKGLSRRIAKMLSAPVLTYGVRSSRKLAYPKGQPPTRVPLSQTAAYDIAPSTSRKMVLPASSALKDTTRRYQPTPLVGSLAIAPLIPGALNGPLIAQSCGILTASQLASLKEA